MICKEDLRDILSEILLGVVKPAMERAKTEEFYFPAIMTLTQLTEYLHVSPQSISNWAKRSEDNNPFPIKYAGGDPRFYQKEVDAWIIEETRRRKLRKNELRTNF